jgi:ribosomal protein S18 acetylase RimI-like enzyme
MSDIEIRPATHADLEQLHPVIERSYRGDGARNGWTHQADLYDRDRTDLVELAELIDGDSRLLVACRGRDMLGCVYVIDEGDGLAHLGMLCVDPNAQAGGIGKLLMAAAEEAAQRVFGASRMELTVIDQRDDLIAYYVRRGYEWRGEVRPFPIPIEPPLEVAVLVKAL